MRRDLARDFQGIGPVSNGTYLRFANSAQMELSLDSIWPILQIIVAADDADFEAWATEQFGTVGKRRPKGTRNGSCHLFRPQ